MTGLVLSSVPLLYAVLCSGVPNRGYSRVHSAPKRARLLGPWVKLLWKGGLHGKWLCKFSEGLAVLGGRLSSGPVLHPFAQIGQITR